MSQTKACFYWKIKKPCAHENAALRVLPIWYTSQRRNGHKVFDAGFYWIHPFSRKSFTMKKHGKEGNSHHWYHASNPNKNKLKNWKIRLDFPPPNVISLCQSKDHSASETMKTQERYCTYNL